MGENGLGDSEGLSTCIDLTKRFVNSMIRRIGLYQSYPHNIGGSQRVLLTLTRYLPAYGYYPIIICPEEGRFTETARCQGLEVLISDPGSAWHVYGQGSSDLGSWCSSTRICQLLLYWHKLGSDLLKRKIALLHCNDYRGVIMAAPAARLAGIPALWHMHGFISSRWLNIFAASVVDRTVPVSNGMLKYWNLPRWLLRGYRVIHNGIDETAIFKETLQVTKAKEYPLVVSIGILHPRKAHEVLIYASKQVIAEIPQVQFWIIGGEWKDGSYGQELRALSKRLGIAESVKFLGHHSDVISIISRSDLVVISSRIEPFGMVALEAMLVGKPVIASRTGGLQDIVVHGETGLLVPPDKPDQLSAAIIKLISDRNLARKMGEAGRCRVLSLFTAQRMASAFATLYGEMLCWSCRGWVKYFKRDKHIFRLCC